MGKWFSADAPQRDVLCAIAQKNHNYLFSTEKTMTRIVQLMNQGDVIDTRTLYAVGYEHVGRVNPMQAQELLDFDSGLAVVLLIDCPDGLHVLVYDSEELGDEFYEHFKLTRPVLAG